MSDLRDSNKGIIAPPVNVPGHVVDTRRVEGGKGSTADHGIEERLLAPHGNEESKARTLEDTSTTSNNEDPSTGHRPITEEEIIKLRADLQQSLQEEERLTIAQMQLISQLEKINGSIISLEKEERLGKLAIQQAQIIRLLKKSHDPGNKEIDDEIITITPER